MLNILINAIPVTSIGVANLDFFGVNKGAKYA